ncbi:EamA family transporter [Paenibacillus sp. LMG 31460]|uniref:EamA family transporter n=1 Tax=Paenibacillus germinis TaxID=2654979 RepID=A0ABX1ZD47_9BACL|nr:EamA family transporter [Paenibacillus germinis]NOU89873.1 EamA family transporter [Paenibacillus germinis]
MWFIAAVGSAVLFGLTGFFMKVSQMRQGSTPHLLLGLYLTGTLGFAVNSLWEGSLFLDDWRVWLAGIIIGVGSGWGNVVFMKALDNGPASLTAPLMNLNILLVILMSVTIYGERLHSTEASGIVLLIASAVLVSIKLKEPLTIKEKKWFALVALGGLLFFFRNGGLKVTAELELANTPILFISYLLSAFWFAIAAVSHTKKQQKPVQQGLITTYDALPSRTGLLWGLLSGCFSYGGLQLYSVALQMGPGSIVAPIFSTYGLVVVVGSVLVYKERLTLLQTIALFLLFAGLILVKL